MKRIEWDYEVKALIKISRVEVDALIRMAEDHYDYTVKAMTKPRHEHERFSTTAGLLYGWRNRFDEGEEAIDVGVTSRQCGLLCKALEPLSMTGGDQQAKHNPDAVPIWLPFRQLAKELNDEYKRLCDDPVAQPVVL